MAEIEISFSLGKFKKFLLLGLLVAVLALELNVTFNNPIAFGDEGFHVSVARYIGTELDYSKYNPLTGSELNPERFTRPPFWNLIEASFYSFFGFDEAFVKFLVPFMSFLTGLVIYTFVRRLYSENLAVIAAAISVTIPSFVTYSVLFYTTVPYVLFFSIAFLSFLMAMKTNQRKFWLVAGIFSGVAILTNIAGLFLPALMAAMALIHLLKTRSMSGFFDAVKTYGLAIFLMLLVLLPLGIRNVGLYALPGCGDFNLLIQGRCPDAGQTYQQLTTNEFAGRTIAGGTEESILNIGVASYLQFAYGFSNPNGILNLIGLAFIPFSFLAGLVIVAKRRNLSDIALMVSVFIFLGVFYQFGGFVEGRSEDTARYFLSAIPLIGISSAAYWSSIKKDEHKLNGLIVLAVLIVIFVLSFLNFYNKLTQMDAVKNFVPSFFQACDWVEENTPEDAKLLSLQTYPTRYNCDRGAGWETPDKADILLSNNLSLVKSRLEANGVDYIFVQKFSLSNTPVGQAWPISFVDFLESNNYTFKKVYENGPRYGTQDLITCINTGCDPGNIIYEVGDFRASPLPEEFS